MEYRLIEHTVVLGILEDTERVIDRVCVLLSRRLRAWAAKGLEPFMALPRRYQAQDQTLVLCR